MTDHHVVAMVFARGGSKGVPGKNIRPLAGKPLLAHAIEAARQSRHVDRVIVSTDDERIAEVARQWGAEVPFLRPPQLAADDSPEWLAWQHAIREVDEQARRRGRATMDVMVSVPATAPLRRPEDVDACIEKLLATDADAVITVAPAHRNPYFNMVTLAADDSIRLAIDGGGRVHRRQDAPHVYDVTTVAYAARPRFVLSAGGLLEGHTRAVVVPPERALDIDTELDFRIAEFLLGERRATSFSAQPQAPALIDAQPQAPADSTMPAPAAGR